MHWNQIPISDMYPSWFSSSGKKGQIKGKNPAVLWGGRNIRTTRLLVEFFRCRRTPGTTGSWVPGRFQGKEPAVINTIKRTAKRLSGLEFESRWGHRENRGGGGFWGAVAGGQVVRTVDGDGEAEGTAAVFAAMACCGGRKGLLLLSFLFPFLASLLFAPNLLMPTILPLFSPFWGGVFFPLWFWF